MSGAQLAEKRMKALWRAAPEKIADVTHNTPPEKSYYRVFTARLSGYGNMLSAEVIYYLSALVKSVFARVKGSLVNAFDPVDRTGFPILYDVVQIQIGSVADIVHTRAA